MKIQHFAPLLLGCIVLIVMAPGFVSAEEQEARPEKPGVADWDIRVEAGADLYSKYIWRGQTLVDDLVVQPGASIGVEEFTASIWGNYTMTDDKEWTEIDYTLDYTTPLDFAGPSLEKVAFSLGYIYYDFPNISSGGQSQEVYAGFAVDVPLFPSLVVYHDYDEGDGTYYEASVSQSVAIDEISLNLSAAVGYNDGQWDYDSSFSSALLGMSIALPFGEKVSLEPGIFYSVALDSQYDDEFYGGFSLVVQLWD
jgi:hypothetical protein